MNKRLIPIGLASASMMAFTSASAQTVIDNAHVDIVFGYGAGLWSLDVELHDEGLEFEPADAILNANANTLQVRPAGGAFGFLGDEGALVNTLPEEDPGEPADRLWLGFEVLDTDGAFLDNQAELTFSNISGPAGGHLFVWQEDAFGSPNLLFSSDTEVAAPNVFLYSDLLLSDHAHFNIAFTAPGTYTVDIGLSAGLAGGEFTSTSDTFAFQAIPEPSTYALFTGIGLLLLVGARRFARNRRS